MSAFATVSTISTVTNLLNQEATALEQERQAIEKELAELAQGKIKLELNGKQIEMELGALDLGSDLAKSRLQLEQKLVRALTENPLGEKLLRAFMREEQLRQALDLPTLGEGPMAQFNSTLNQRAARFGCGALMATPALIVVGLVVLALGLLGLFGSSNSSDPARAGIYPTNPTLTVPGSNNTLYPNTATSNFTRPIFSNSGSNSPSQANEYDQPTTPTPASSSPANANLSSSSKAGSSFRQTTGLPFNPAAGSLSSTSSSSREANSTANSYSEPSDSKVNLVFNPTWLITKPEPAVAGTEGAGDENGDEQQADEDASNRVGLPPSSAGGYNGPHGAFLPPSLLSVPALGLTGVPVVRALTQERQDEQTGEPTLSLIWPRPFEVAHFGAYPGELGNCVILGTQSSLGTLRRLQLNDEIRLADRKGNLFVYRVVAFSPTGQSERLVDLSQESWLFANTAEAVLTILITPPQEMVPLSKNPANGQEQAAPDDWTTPRRLAYRAVLSLYAPVVPTSFGTPVAVKSQVWQIPTSTPTPTATTPLPQVATITPTTPTTASATVPATPQPSSPAQVTPGATTSPESISTATPLPGLPHTGDGSCANGGCGSTDRHSGEEPQDGDQESNLARANHSSLIFGPIVQQRG